MEGGPAPDVAVNTTQLSHALGNTKILKSAVATASMGGTTIPRPYRFEKVKYSAGLIVVARSEAKNEP